MRRHIFGLILLTLSAGCSQYQLFDSRAHVEADLESRIPAELRSYIEVPYHLDEDVLAEISAVPRRSSTTSSAVSSSSTR